MNAWESEQERADTERSLSALLLRFRHGVAVLPCVVARESTAMNVEESVQGTVNRRASAVPCKIIEMRWTMTQAARRRCGTTAQRAT